MLLNGYVRVLPKEVSPENVVREGPVAFLKLSLGEVEVKTRKLCTIGFVTSIQRGSTYTDITLALESGQVTVRVWDTQGVGDLLEGLKKDSKVLVFGVLREYREQIYISAVLLRAVTEEEISKFKRKLFADRKILLNIAKKQ
ncbi:OB-fold nucleic acid binding domain-containing protein [Infirmifilum sp. NZ]|uniref:OB-fold nucleic acid binding domain-containing protein n=1 Tax=Infirmifilum sp. NZ TaxID=2926850 RepID=UPI0027A226CD|nr:OB-fold nucleic acid binding domain-containing protein [Infirmifilum sp. NZ]UNQ74345.1 OB-fold nucleic acid binding domain-containing protein [Infirmifilum sp. NZ]